MTPRLEAGVIQLLLAGAVYAFGLLWVLKTKRTFQVGDLVINETPIAMKNAIGAPLEAYKEEV